MSDTPLTIHTYPWVTTDAQKLLDENERLKDKLDRSRGFAAHELQINDSLCEELTRLRTQMAAQACRDLTEIQLLKAENEQLKASWTTMNHINQGHQAMIGRLEAQLAAYERKQP